MSDSPTSGAPSPPKLGPLIHPRHGGAWGNFGHDVGTKDERWYCRGLRE